MLGCLAAIIVNLFTYRLNAVVPKVHIFSLSKVGHVNLSVAVVTCCLIGVAVALIGTGAGQAEAKLWVTAVCVPTIGLTIPILLVIYSMAAAVDIGQRFANTLMFIIALQGFMSCVTVILCNEPYRMFAVSFLPKLMTIHCRELDLKPQYYITAMEALSVINIPINVFVLYCIATRSPQQMYVYKCLFTYRLNAVVPRAHVFSLSKVGHMYLSVAVVTCCLISIAVGLVGTGAGQAEAKLWVAEVSVPTIGFTIPILVIIYSMAAAVDIGQRFANALMFIIALQGFMSCVTVILCNEPYRMFAASFLPKQLRGTGIVLVYDEVYLLLHIRSIAVAL
ncbi:unnamed protein product [Nippostrongylus brasiliensis]|uniref:G protein-coupled receptor n=1 Tax=Nippostrongylus brasiliensis TaxID=27835 RepID=A0A158QYS4_NIPBR|nr:unnamed protein product [Nippostrongylus brasiliensis]